MASLSDATLMIRPTRNGMKRDRRDVGSRHDTRVFGGSPSAPGKTRYSIALLKDEE